MDRWIMIVNPKSASAATVNYWADSESMLREAGLDVTVCPTQFAGHAIKLAQEAAAQGIRKFIATGGDGTVHEVMTGLLRYSDATGTDLGGFTFAVLSYGTGNDWIRTPGVPADFAEAAKCIIRGNTAKEDIVRATFGDGSVFCVANVAGVGLDADICVRTNKLKKMGRRGSILFKLVAPYTIFSRKLKPVEFVCDGQVLYSGILFSAAIGNGLYRGGGVRQTLDESSWDDGMLEISILGNVGRIKATVQTAHALMGDYVKLPGIINKRFRKITIKPLGEEADNVELDGEVPGTLPVTIEVTGMQINIIVP